MKNEHSDVMRERYYLTRVKRECRCASCGTWLRVNTDMVFRKLGPVTLCVRCADNDPLVDYRLSTRWEKAKARERAHGPWAGREKAA